MTDGQLIEYFYYTPTSTVYHILQYFGRLSTFHVIVPMLLRLDYTACETVSAAAHRAVSQFWVDDTRGTATRSANLVIVL